MEVNIIGTKGLFSVIRIKEDMMIRTEVYAVRDDKNGYPHFLIYDDGEWKYISAKHFVGETYGSWRLIKIYDGRYGSGLKL